MSRPDQHHDRPGGGFKRPRGDLRSGGAALEVANGLTDAQLEVIAELEARVVAADGGRLKLEWGSLWTRSRLESRDLLLWRSHELIGFLGLYMFGRGSLELAGMVDPECRRRGAGTTLLEAARPLCQAQHPRRVLLVVPRNGSGGDRFAAAHGGALHHSEHAMSMALDERPHNPAPPVEVTVRPAAEADRDAIASLLEDGFGEPPTAEQTRPVSGDGVAALVVELQGTVVGTARIAWDGDGGSIYGFVVGRPWRGRGIGRAVLRELCEALGRRGVRRVGLEVEVTNERALGLYTSVGFNRVNTEDYYELPWV